MIRTPTTFIIGAGASREFDLPLGDKLTKYIADALNIRLGSESHARDLVKGAFSFLAVQPSGPRRDFNELMSKALKISGQLATASSIDVFIDNHVHDKDIEMIGKLGIAACLIEAERLSLLVPRKDGQLIDLLAVENTWLARLFNVLVEGVRATAIPEMFSNVAFVVFNYDRCLEHYLQHAISSRFDISLEEAGSIVGKHCRIVHPYGLLGPVFADPHRVPFGETISDDTFGGGPRVLQLAQRIRTFTETSHGPEKSAVQQYVATAGRLVFVGFGFQHQNVDLLRVPNSDCSDFRATVVGMSASNKREILRNIRSIAHLSALVGDMDCLLELKGCDFIPAESLFLAR